MIIRCKDKKGNINYGILKKDEVHLITGNIFLDYHVTDKTLRVEDVTILAPTDPSKVVCIGLNYLDHANEMNLKIPKEPLLFLKPSTAVVATKEEIIYPEQTKQVEYEAELAIVIGKEAKAISEEEAKDAIFGYSIANDVTARDLQFSDGQWTRGKSFDRFCPIGPGIVRDVDPNTLDISLYMNGERKQHSNTKNLIFNVEFLVSYVSQVMTLLPGDVIITGTPHGVGPVYPGDEMVVKIQDIGELRNKLVKQIR